MAEASAAKDLNNLYRASCYFRDPERYGSFCAFYAVMRIVDDRVDGLMRQPAAFADQIGRGRVILEAWHRAVLACLSGSRPSERDLLQTDHSDARDLLGAFAEAARLFPTPANLWNGFFGAMRRDLSRRRLATYGEFLQYAGGAAVAPATIYLYLITADGRAGGPRYRPPPDFELVECGRDLGSFAYLGHVLRDLRQDLAEARCYLAADDMAAHGVTERSLLADLASGCASQPLRALVRDLVVRSRTLARKGRVRMQTLEGRLGPDRAFVLELIVRIYEAVLDKIVSCSYDVMTDAHKLTDTEKRGIALDVAGSLRCGLGV